MRRGVDGHGRAFRSEFSCGGIGRPGDAAGCEAFLVVADVDDVEAAGGQGVRRVEVVVGRHVGYGDQFWLGRGGFVGRGIFPRSLLLLPGLRFLPRRFRGRRGARLVLRG